MKTLQIDRKEALEVYNADMAIEYQEKETQEFDLPPEKEKIAKKFAHTGTRQTKEKEKGKAVYNFDKKPRKENSVKRSFISKLADFLSTVVKEITVTNPEREVQFRLGEEWYKLTLTYCRNMNKADKK